MKAITGEGICSGGHVKKANIMDERRPVGMLWSITDHDQLIDNRYT